MGVRRQSLGDFQFDEDNYLYAHQRTGTRAAEKKSVQHLECAYYCSGRLSNQWRWMPLYSSTDWNSCSGEEVCETSGMHLLFLWETASSMRMKASILINGLEFVQRRRSLWNIWNAPIIPLGDCQFNEDECLYAHQQTGMVACMPISRLKWLSVYLSTDWRSCSNLCTGGAKMVVSCKSPNLILRVTF